MRNFLNLNIITIHVLFLIIYQNVECTSSIENDGINGTISTVTENMYANITNGLNTFVTNGRKVGARFNQNIVLKLLIKFFYDLLPAFVNYVQAFGSYVQGRCFGAVRKLQMTFIPLFFKLGVIVTILIFLTAMTAKGLLIGITLLFFNFTGFFAKLYAGKLGSQHAPAPSWHYPHVASSWVQPTVVKPTIKNIHVHVHPPPGSSHHSEDSSIHYPIEEYGSTYHRPSSSYEHKLSSLDLNDIHYPPIRREYEIYDYHQPHVLEQKMDYLGNSLLPASAASTNIYQPNLLHRYDDISAVSTAPSSGLTAEENAYIQRILSKLS